jgi:hypothetical protein
MFRKPKILCHSEPFVASYPMQNPMQNSAQGSKGPPVYASGK